jgi:hypothetical protein
LRSVSNNENLYQHCQKKFIKFGAGIKGSYQHFWKDLGIWPQVHQGFLLKWDFLPVGIIFSSHLLFGDEIISWFRQYFKCKLIWKVNRTHLYDVCLHEYAGKGFAVHRNIKRANLKKLCCIRSIFSRRPNNWGVLQIWPHLD